MKYLAYFQAYTNTYARVEQLRQMYEEALEVEDVVGLSLIHIFTVITQLGYALGLFFLIPLGDMLSRKKLILVNMTIADVYKRQAENPCRELSQPDLSTLNRPDGDK